MAFTYRFNPMSKKFDIVQDSTLLTLKGVVATTNDLPLTGNSENDIYVCSADDRLYTWNSASDTGLITDWVDCGSVLAVDWSIITNKPSSSVSDIDLAVAHKDLTDNPHTVTKTQIGLDNVENVDTTDANNINTDDSGVTVQEALDEIESNQHTQNTDTKLDEGGANEVSASEIPKAYINDGVVDYYIENSGNDVTGDGSVGSPWATLQYTLSQCKKFADGEGTSYHIHIGTGSFGVTTTIYNFRVPIKISGNGKTNTLLGKTQIHDCDYVFIEDVYTSSSDYHFEVYNSKVILDTIDLINSTFGIMSDYNARIYAKTITAHGGMTYGCVTSRGGMVIYDGTPWGNTFHYASSTGVVIEDNITLDKADYDSAVSLKHTQNTDTTLDSGGANEISASNIKTHVESTDNPHNVTADQVATSNSGETVQDVLDTGVSGSFTTVDGKTVTVTDGIITSIV